MKKLGPMTVITAWASRLRYPQLFFLTAGLFLLDFFIVDPIPLMDEALLALLTLLVGSLKTRGEDPEETEREIKNVTPPNP
ncbi:MAG: DUF6116 family protein [Acidobacteriota bacterium]